MLRDIYFGVRLPFERPDEQRHSQEILRRLLGIVCRLNLLYLKRHPGTPALYDSGVRYTPPDQTNAPPLDRDKLRKILSLMQSMGLTPDIGEMVLRIMRGAETFRDIPSLYRRKEGDCNELVPVRVAELWRAGIMATPWLVDPVRGPNGGLSYHAIVVWPDGSAEDPSLILGMGGPARAADRKEEIRKNHERWDNYLGAAKLLMAAGEARAEVLGAQLDQMGLLPRGGFRE